MYLEIYADSLLLLHLCLNLFLLNLVNVMLYHAATLKCIVRGAAVGAVAAVLPVFFIGPGIWGLGIGFVLSVGLMCKYTFRVRGISQWIKVLEKLSVATLLMGGILLMLRKLLPPLHQITGIIGVLLPGAAVFFLVSERLHHNRQGEKECYVIVQKGKEKLRLKALMDTGNLLREPISQRPVAVVDEVAFKALFADNIPEGYRMIPYQSVGKKHGILKGYYRECLTVEKNGTVIDCHGIYVAIGESFCGREGGYQVILSPDILEKKGEEKKYDFKNAVAGGNWGEIMVSQKEG